MKILQCDRPQLGHYRLPQRELEQRSGAAVWPDVNMMGRVMRSGSRGSVSGSRTVQGVVVTAAVAIYGQRRSSSFSVANVDRLAVF